MSRIRLILSVVALALAALFGAAAWAKPVAARAPQLVTMNVVVSLPATTPPDDTIFVAGNFQQPNPWDPGATPLTRDGLQATGTIQVPEGTTVEFKFTRGSWETVEKGPACEEIANRTAQPEEGGTIEATVAAWRDVCEQEPPFYDSRVQTVTLASEALGVTKQFYLYTPPGYEADGESEYPTLYLFRGHEREWINPNEDATRGGTNVVDVYEALLNAGEVGPMILVFPGISSADNSISGFLTDFLRPDLVPADDQPSVGTGRWEDYFINEVIPHVDANFRTIADRSGRGVDGFSLGGFMSAKIAGKYPNLFRSVGAYDGTFLYADDSCATISPSDGLFNDPAYNSLFDPVFGPLPRDGAYAADNNAPNLVCNSTPEAMQGLVWLVQYGPEEDEPGVNFYRGEHLMAQLAAKGVTNGISPTILTGGHNWATADEHMRQTLPLHYAAFQQPTAIQVGAPMVTPGSVPLVWWLAGLGSLAGGTFAITRRRARAVTR